MLPDTWIRSGVLVLVVVGWGHLTWIPWSQHSCHTCWDRCSLSLRGCPPPGSNPLGRGKVYRFVPEVPLFRGSTDGARSIFETTGCVWALFLRLVPTKKAMCHTRANVKRLTDLGGQSGLSLKEVCTSTATQGQGQGQQGSSVSHCTKWADDQHSQAGLEPRLMPNLLLS